MSGRSLRSTAKSAAQMAQATISTTTPTMTPTAKAPKKPKAARATPTITPTATTTPNPPPPPGVDLPIHLFPTAPAFDAWLSTNGTTTPAGIFLQISKKASPIPSITYDAAVDTALCHGWIDGQRRSLDALSFLQRFTPRRRNSVWSKRNVDKVAALTAAGRMQEAGRKEVEAAQGDGRWERAYSGSKELVVPRELGAALEAAGDRVRAAWEGLGRAERFKACFRVGTARREETRMKRAGEVVRGLEGTR